MASYPGFGDPRASDWSGQNLTTVTSPSGARFTVNRAIADKVTGFLEELESGGYKVASGGGYNLRNVTGGSTLSPHAYGLAFDVNPTSNPYSKTPSGGELKTDLPANVSEMAGKWGLEWGGDWKSLKDPMHFELAGARRETSEEGAAAGNQLSAATPKMTTTDLGQLPDFNAIASNITKPVNTLTPAAAGQAIISGSGTVPSSPLADPLAMMSLLAAGTHKFVPVSYDPFAISQTAAKVPLPAVSVAPSITSKAPQVTPATTPATGLGYVARLGMRKAYEAATARGPTAAVTPQMGLDPKVQNLLGGIT